MKTSPISTKAFGTGAAISRGQLLQPAPGHSVACLFARIVGAFPRGAAYRALRLNQWMMFYPVWAAELATLEGSRP